MTGPAHSVGAVAVVPTLSELTADPARLERQPIGVLVELRRQARHLLADLDAALDRIAATEGRGEAGSGEVLGIEKAARRLGTSPDSLYRKRARLRLGYRDPLDGKIKFTAGELDEYIRRQRRA